MTKKKKPTKRKAEPKPFEERLRLALHDTANGLRKEYKKGRWPNSVNLLDLCNILEHIANSI